MRTRGRVRNARTVTQLPPELVLAKQLADALKTPICIVDAGGNAVHFNEAAEMLLGRDRAATEALTALELGARLAFTNIEGTANAVVCRASPLGEVIIVGPGAGPELAGQGVLSDLIAVARS